MNHQGRLDTGRLQASTKAFVGNFLQPGPTRLFYRGDPEAPRDEVTPGALAKFVSLKIDAKTPEQKRRLALADWIVSDTNPLARRVIVNRIWQHHFGAGLVDTPNDFGRNGVAPSCSRQPGLRSRQCRTRTSARRPRRCAPRGSPPMMRSARRQVNAALLTRNKGGSSGAANRGATAAAERYVESHHERPLVRQGSQGQNPACFIL